MTFWELIRVLARYWPVVLIGAICTAGAGLASINDDGFYFTRAKIAFRAPVTADKPNAFRTQSEEVIITAGVVAKRLSGPEAVPKFASPDVTLVGLGTRDGWSLRLPDTGGQWATNFTTQMLILDVVGSSEQEVVDRRNEVITRVEDELNSMQRAAGTAPAYYITAAAAPEATQVYQIHGNRPRALGMTALLGIGVTVAAILTIDRIRGRRSRRSVARATPTPALAN